MGQQLNSARLKIAAEVQESPGDNFAAVTLGVATSVTLSANTASPVRSMVEAVASRGSASTGGKLLFVHFGFALPYNFQSLIKTTNKFPLLSLAAGII